VTSSPHRTARAEHSNKEEFQLIGPACAAWLSGAGLDEIRVLGAVVAAWDDVVGPDVALHARPVGLAHGELKVSVDHPSWATELSFLTNEIINGLQDHLGVSPARTLRVTIRAPEGLQ